MHSRLATLDLCEKAMRMKHLWEQSPSYHQSNWDEYFDEAMEGLVSWGYLKRLMPLFKLCNEFPRLWLVNMPLKWLRDNKPAIEENILAYDTVFWRKNVIKTPRSNLVYDQNFKWNTTEFIDEDVDDDYIVEWDELAGTQVLHVTDKAEQTEAEVEVD